MRAGISISSEVEDVESGCKLIREQEIFALTNAREGSKRLFLLAAGKICFNLV